MFRPSSRTRLTDRDLGRFPDRTLHHRLARAVCHAGCLPRKELYEAWEVARRVRRLFRGGRVVDVAGGHGLLALTMLLLDDTSPAAIVIDSSVPPSASRVYGAVVADWPRLAGRVEYRVQPLADGAVAAGDVVVSSHACGALTDRILELAAAARVRVAVLPCCHDFATLDAGSLSGWLDRAVAIDAMRAIRLRQHAYRIWTQTIPGGITPQNRLLIGAPLDEDAR